MTLVSPLEGYRLWAASYDESLNPVVALESRSLAAQLPELAGKRVADVACGTGRWARYAVDRGARVVAMDRCSEMLDRCDLPAVLSDAGALPLPDASMDVAICALALGYFDSPMTELCRITRSGGCIVVSDVHPKALDRGWTHSFRSGSEVYEIEHRRYSLQRLLNTYGLRLESVTEPRFGEPERPIFRRAGKEALFETMSQIPAIFVARWTRL